MSHRIIRKSTSCLNCGSLFLSRIADLAAERTKKSQLRGAKDRGASVATSDKRRRDKFTVGHCEIDKHIFALTSWNGLRVSREAVALRPLEGKNEAEEKHAEHLVLNRELSKNQRTSFLIRAKPREKNWWSHKTMFPVATTWSCTIRTFLQETCILSCILLATIICANAYKVKERVHMRTIKSNYAWWYCI